MGQRKGQTGNPNGRPKGSPNKATASMREKISTFCNENWERIQEDFNDLKPDERIKAFEKFLQYIIPKMTENSLKIDYEEMTEEQINALVKNLLNDL